MESMLRKLKVDTKNYTKDTVVEVFIAIDNKNSKEVKNKQCSENKLLYVTIKGLKQDDMSENLKLDPLDLNNYFKQEDGLDKVYLEYSSKVGSDILKYSKYNSNKRLKINIVALIISLTLVCTATILGGTYGILLSALSLINIIIIEIIARNKLKYKIDANDKNMAECRNTRKNELIHMLTNLGYL